MPKRDLVCRARAKLATSSSPDLSLFDCGFSNATNAVSIIAFPSSSDGLQVHFRRQRDQIEQLVAIHSRRIHRHFHPQLLLVRSLLAEQRRLRADFAGLWAQRFYGGDGECRTRFEIGSAADGLEF